MGLIDEALLVELLEWSESRQVRYHITPIGNKLMLCVLAHVPNYGVQFVVAHADDISDPTDSLAQVLRVLRLKEVAYVSML